MISTAREKITVEYPVVKLYNISVLRERSIFPLVFLAAAKGIITKEGVCGEKNINDNHDGIYFVDGEPSRRRRGNICC